MASANVDMSLDEFIKAKKIKPNRGGGRGGRGGRGRGGRGGRGRGGSQNRGASANRGVQKGGRGRGGQRGGFKNFRGQQKRGGGFFRPRAAANVARNFQAGGRPQISTGPAKIQITNLDFGVSDSDIKELFSEFGSLKMAAIHYNAQGKSMGTASLVYARRGDAVKAIKQYNGVALDGRTMNLRLEGAQVGAGAGGFKNTSPVKRLGRGAVGIRGNRGARGGARGKFVARGAGRGGARGGQRGRGGKGRGAGRGGRGGRGGKANKAKPKTAEQLDAELDAYIQTKI